MRTRHVILGTVTLAILMAAGFRAASNQATPAPAAPAATTAPPGMASGVSEVMKLFQGGTSADVIAGYVRNSPLSFYLTADNILFLQQQGVPEPVIMAMIQRYGELQRQTGMAARAAAPIPARAPAPRYESYAPQYPAASYGYIPATGNPVSEPYYYYDSWYCPGGPGLYPSGFAIIGGIGRTGFARGALGGRVGAVGSVGRVGSVGHVGGGGRVGRRR